MAKKKILFVEQELAPYLSTGEMSKLGHALPQNLHQHGYEPRICVPKFGSVNERRNQLHEVIRLSGMNITIDDADRPLIVKVASLPPSRLQVYFIDSDELFQKSDSDADAVGSNRDDNDQRAIFFARGTAETVRKLKWNPAVMQCMGWITALVPAYMRRFSAPDAPEYKIVYAVLPGGISGKIDPKMLSRLATDGIDIDTQAMAINPDELSTDDFHKIAVAKSDAVIIATPEISDSLRSFIDSRGIPVLPWEEASKGPDAFREFYDTL